MNERVKELRSALGLSAEKFGARIGVTRSAISKMELGVCNISEQSIISICREFNVSEEWLRTGTGDMFYTMSQDEELAYIVGQALPTASEEMKDTFIAIGKLSKQFTAEEWSVIRRFLRAIAGDDK